MLTMQEKELLKENLKKQFKKFNQKYLSKDWYIKSIFKKNLVITIFASKDGLIDELIKVEEELKTMLNELLSNYQLLFKENGINCCNTPWQTYYLEV